MYPSAATRTAYVYQATELSDRGKRVKTVEAVIKSWDFQHAMRDAWEYAYLELGKPQIICIDWIKKLPIKSVNGKTTSPMKIPGRKKKPAKG